MQERPVHGVVTPWRIYGRRPTSILSGVKQPYSRSSPSSVAMVLVWSEVTPKENRRVKTGVSRVLDTRTCIKIKLLNSASTWTRKQAPSHTWSVVIIWWLLLLFHITMTQQFRHTDWRSLLIMRSEERNEMEETMSLCLATTRQWFSVPLMPNGTQAPFSATRNSKAVKILNPYFNRQTVKCA